MEHELTFSTPEVTRHSREPALPTRSNALELDFELGGPAYRLLQRVGVIKGAGPSVVRRSLWFVAITWVPLLILTALQGNALGPTPRSSFLLDFATYARFFIAGPLIFAAEIVVGPRFRSAGLRFIDAGIVQPASYSGYLAAVDRVKRRRDALLPEVSFALIALFSAGFVTFESVVGLTADSWRTQSVNGLVSYSPAALWYGFVAIPLLKFFLLRWLWRLGIWTLFLWDVSRLRLNLIATHTDMAAGLGFLGIAHQMLSIFPFAASCVFCAELAFRIWFEGMDLVMLKSMIPLLVAYLIFVELVTFGPLVIFIPLLARVRRDGLQSYGIFVQHHNALFHRKWIEGEKSDGELPLGNPDMSSLVDLGSSFTVVRQMNIIPVGRAQLIVAAVIACLPGLPLAFMLLPFTEMLQLLAGVIS